MAGTSSASACSARSRPGRRRSPALLAERTRRSGTPSTAAPTPRSAATGRTVDERGVHAHRADAVLVRGLPRRLGARACSSATPTRSRRRSSTRSTSASPTHAFDDLVERRYDLYLVCGLDVPWRHDGIREFEEQRHWMHERYLERAQASGAPWLLVEGSRRSERGCRSSTLGSRVWIRPAPPGRQRVAGGEPAS